jgi:pyridoxal phosphate enzyme (YggS family)
LAVNSNLYDDISAELAAKNVALVAVSKTKPAKEILELYDLGQRDFGENYVGELVEKYEQLPRDIRWHFIGHLQSNKVKYIAPFISLIQAVDSKRLLNEIDKHGKKTNRVIDCLLQLHIAREETKFGLNENELDELMKVDYKNVHVRGLMGMASFTDNIGIIKSEFIFLKSLFDKYFTGDDQGREGLRVRSLQSGLQDSFVPFSEIRKLPVLSMGMSADYKIAVEQGSNMVRIGSLLFGER